MAENDNTGDAENGNRNGNGGDALAAAAAIYEGRLLLEAGRVGVETLVNRSTPASLAELNVVHRLLTQAGDALDAAQREMFNLFGVEIGHA
jgi:hypothetical protein